MNKIYENKDKEKYMEFDKKLYEHDDFNLLQTNKI